MKARFYHFLADVLFHTAGYLFEIADRAVDAAWKARWAGNELKPEGQS